MAVFRFKQFCVSNTLSAMKVNTDGVLLGAAMSIPQDATLMLDIGTGTGTIALMAAQRHPGANIHAIDIDEASAREAAENFAASPWADRLSASCTSLAGFRPSNKYSHIFSNPPYYDNSLMNPDSREGEARHSVSLSYRDILAFATDNLQEQGTLSLILPADTEKMLLRASGGWGLFPFRLLRIRTTPAKKPSRLIAEFSRNRVPVKEELLTIQESGTYTQEYKSLTSEFYLF